MAASYHTRSNSFPSRTIPIVSQFDEQLNRIKSSEFASSSTITSKISVLSDLYVCIDELLQLPSSQTAFSCQSAENVLEGSILLLDSCSTIIDVLVQMKERSQELQSILRRRCSKDETAMEVSKYLRSRKTAIKVVSKILKDLKKIKNEISNEVNDVINKLRECQMVTCNVLESILVALVGSKASKSWESVVSKMLKSKGVAKQQETELFLVGFEASTAVLHPEEVRSGLENVEISIKNVEEGVEILLRYLVKTRSSVLNILNC